MSFFKDVTNQGHNRFWKPKPKKEDDDETYDTATQDEGADSEGGSGEEAESKLTRQFLEDWKALRTRHPGQQKILDAVLDKGKRYVFLRIGRKGAKTSTNIDLAWALAFKKPRRTVYICCPTIEQGFEIYWEENRLQWCDSPDPGMFSKYVKAVNNQKYKMTMVNGSIIKLIGTWNEARGRGTQPDVFVGDEIQDCSPEYLDAMEPNMAAKPHSVWILSGTPPKKKNHYHVWEERIKKNPEGFHVHYSSYVNTALPHLKGWLDSKRNELRDAGKEDVWLREYMAEDCFRSDDRVLPDLQLTDFDQLLFELKSTDPTIFQPIFGLVVNEHHLTAIYAVLFHTKYTGSKIYTLESDHLNKIWDKGYGSIFAEMSKKMDSYSSTFKKPWRKIVYDESSSFCDIVSGFSESRKDLKWSKRGVPLLREMIHSQKLIVSTQTAKLGVEAQNMLKEDELKDFPHICAMAMIANEYYQPASMNNWEKEQWDRLQPLRDAGLVVNVPKQKGLRPYRGKFT
jgi:hypothetical protein